MIVHTLENKIYNLSKKYGKKLGFDLPYFIKNGFWTFLRLLINSILALTLYIFFTRFSSQEVFGQYQFVLSIIAVIYIFSIPGLNTSLLRSVARGYDGDYKFAVKKSFLSSLLGVPVLFIIGVCYYYFSSHSLGISLMISSIFFPFFYAPNTWEWFLQGKHQFNALMRFSVIQTAWNTIATILVILMAKNNLIFIIIIYLISYTFFNCFYYHRSLKYIENNKKDEKFLEYGWFLTKINISGIIANNIDKILVGILLGPANLAIYAVMTFVVFRVRDAFKSAMALFFPKMSTLKDDFSGILRLHKYKLLLFLLGLTVLSSLYYAGISFINNLMFTEKYSQYSYISQIFTVTFFLSIPVSILGYYVNATKNEFAIILTNPVFYAMQIIINIFFIMKFGLLGAAIGLNLSMIILIPLYVYSIAKKEKMASIAKTIN
jgi:O-antigen/teichoic acid export membrane protein